MVNLSLEASRAYTKRARDSRIIFGARLLKFRNSALVLEDKYALSNAVTNAFPINTREIKFPTGHPRDISSEFLKHCTLLAEDSARENLSKIAVEATLYYAHITRLLTSSGQVSDSNRAEARKYTERANELLKKAAEYCTRSFSGATELAKAVERSLQLMGKEWYEEVSQEEIEAIKAAMVSSRSGIATHSGHWYNCENGHPVSTRY